MRRWRGRTAVGSRHLRYGDVNAHKSGKTFLDEVDEDEEHDELDDELHDKTRKIIV